MGCALSKREKRKAKKQDAAELHRMHALAEEVLIYHKSGGEKCYDPRDRTLRFVDGPDDMDCKSNLTLRLHARIVRLFFFIFFFL